MLFCAVLLEMNIFDLIFMVGSVILVCYISRCGTVLNRSMATCAMLNNG